MATRQSCCDGKGREDTGPDAARSSQIPVCGAGDLPVNRTDPERSSAPVRTVLLLQSFARGNMSLDDFTGNFRVELDKLGRGTL